MDWIKDIENYEPYNEQEIKDKDLILKCIKLHDDILTRENTIAHITSSGYIVNKSRTKVLMIYHKIYKSWAWTGGHADGDSNLLHVAIKEAKEETGLKNVTPITETILGLRCTLFGYQYSEILRSLMCVYLCGGSCTLGCHYSFDEPSLTSSDTSHL